MQEGKGRRIAGDYTHLEDMAMKSAAQFFGEEMLGFLGIHKKVLRVAPTELIHLEVHQLYEDFNFEMEGGEWYHFEFESDSIKTADLKRFREYEAVASRTYGVTVVTYVICSSNVKEFMAELNEGINTYRVIVIRLKDQDADTIFNSLLNKSGNGISKDELIPVLLTPLMAGQMPQKDRILKGFEILRESRETITENELTKMQAVLYALAVKFLNDTELDTIKEAINMTKLGQMLVEDGIEQGITLGIRQEREEGIRVLITTCRELGLDDKNIILKVMEKYRLTYDETLSCLERLP